jgi:hypothetical protein
MSTDPSAAIGRIDAAVEESSGSSTLPPRELADLAAAIERIETLIAEGAAQGPDGGAAVEQISDIAFTLHDHEVEIELRDTLDAAVREINNGDALKNLSAERKQEAAELLRQLSRRVHDMIAQSQADQPSKTIAATNAAQTSKRHRILDEGDGEDDAADDSAFKTDMPEDDEFALVVAALTATLPSLPEFGAPVPVPPAALDRGDEPPLPDITLLPELSVETGDEGKAAESESPEETIVVIESSSATLLDEPVLPQTPSSEGAAGDELAAAEPPLALGEDFVRDLMPSENPAAELSVDVASSADEPAKGAVTDALLALPAPTASPGDETEAPRETEEQDVAAAADPAQIEAARSLVEDSTSVAPLPLVAPEDDPGDLFDLTMPEPSISPKPERIEAQAAERVLEPDGAFETALSVPAPLGSKPQPPQQSRAAAAAPVPRPASNDPLGPVGALSEEETIALFS